MGVTVQQLGHSMTAQEFAQHLALEQEEPIPAAHWRGLGAILAALANGPLQAPEQGRMWAAHDFAPALWQDLVADAANPQDPTAPAPEPAHLTVDQIMARARLAGMVH